MSIFKRLFKKKQTTVTTVPVIPATIVDFDPTNIQILVFGSCTSGRNILRNQWCYEYDPAQIPSITNEAQVRLLAVETVIEHGRRIFYETKSLTGDNWVCKYNKLT
jgi:chemotaxis receptor (MCP) glutamine deamidase CheD